MSTWAPLQVNVAILHKERTKFSLRCGPHAPGSKVTHGQGLKSVKDASKAGDEVYWNVFTAHHRTLSAAMVRQMRTIEKDAGRQRSVRRPKQARRRC